MGRHRRRGWVSPIVHAVASVVAVCAFAAVCVSSSDAVPDPGNARLPEFGSAAAAAAAYRWDSASRPFTCPSPAKNADHFLLVVSTIDGTVSAIDLRTSGDLLWSVTGDDRPLLSSSISNIQITRDGVPTRLIPSLDGGLYEFDGDDIKAIPMTAESLLSSSVRLTDNCVMVGGKEVGSYGVDILTGQLSYQCTSTGCRDTTEAANGGGDMLLITRNMQTVRAVDVGSGSEKWNFSVGQHDLMFVPSQKDNPGIEHESSTPDSGEDDITVNNCFPSGEELDEMLMEEEQQKQLIKVVVSDGLIVGLNPEDPTEMAWSRKFSSPVAKAWILHRGKLEPISLFDSKFVPSLSSSQPPFQHYRKNNHGDPLLYVGMHKRQLYVLKEEPDNDSCEKKLPWILDRGPRKAILHVPRVTWQPYLAKAESHTPLFLGNKAPNIPLLGETNDEEELTDEEGSGNSLTVWHENYPFDMGYYLYPRRLVDDELQLDLEPEEEEGIMDVLPASLWMWWKEVVAISLLVSLVFHLVITHVIYRPVIAKVESGSLETKDSSGSLISNDSIPTLLDDKQAAMEFKSRFADEFECIEQLGKGGYGIVFRARNKVDEQEYAVKRIALPNRDGTAKDKMLREVRTLAKLDHVGIVRYFHSWIEDPPPGWQEERDKSFSIVHGTSEGLSPVSDTTPSSADPHAISLSSSALGPNPPEKRPVPLRQSPSLLDDIMPFRPDNLDQDLGAHRFPRVGTGSGEFSVHSNAEGSTDESGSFSLGGGDVRDLKWDESRDSFTIEFQNSGPESDWNQDGVDVSCSGDSALPFRHYAENGRCGSLVGSHKGSGAKEDSLSIVFEDSCNKHSSESSSIVFEDSCNKHSSETSSIVFEDSRDKPNKVAGGRHEFSKSALSDSSYGGSVDDNDSGKSATNNSRVADFTLSSHSGGEDVAADPEQGKQARDVDRKPVPKLYLYLQMQLCRLETLKDWLISNTLNRERMVILGIFEQIVSAVDYVHAKGLIHRDLKPSNIFFALDSTVKVGDFGLVAHAENQADSSQHAPVGKTSAKHTAEVGTQLYMSPEQVQKKPYDQKVDIFSLGLIFLELLMPFSTGMERVTTLQNARKGVFPERFLRELPVESGLVKQLTSSNAQKRPTTEEVLEHSLLKDLNIPRRTGYRYRTISSSSNHSDPALLTEC